MAVLHEFTLQIFKEIGSHTVFFYFSPFNKIYYPPPKFTFTTFILILSYSSLI